MSPDLKSVKIIGQTINSIKKAFVREKFATKFIVDAVGEHVEEDKFYPAEGFLKALDNIGSKMDVAVLQKIGTKIIESAQWPPGVDNLTAGLQSISVAYKMNHQPNDVAIIGDYEYNKIGENEFTITATNPYPCDFDLGIVRGVAKTFESGVFVRHLEGSCRKRGNSKCVYQVKKI